MRYIDANWVYMQIMRHEVGGRHLTSLWGANGGVERGVRVK